MKKVVIIGAGFGGLRVAQSLNHSEFHITVIDRNNYHLFQPLLYQVATAGLNPANIAVPIRQILHRQKNTEVLMSEVVDVNVEKNAVILKEGREIQFDYLIVATGARHSYFGHHDWEKFAPGLKSIEDATYLRRKILIAFEKAELETDLKKQRELLTFVIVGGGPTGVEMAGAIAELAHKTMASDFRHIHFDQAQVILLEAGSKILASFPESLSLKAMEFLKKLRVTVSLNSKVEMIDEAGVTVNGNLILTQTIIWAAGVMASPAGKWLKTEVDPAGRVKVQKDLTLLNYPHIFVIGDASSVMSSQNRPLPGVAPVAIQQGKYVAQIINEKRKGKTTHEPFQYFDKGNLATIGRSVAVLEFKKIKMAGFLAWIVWSIVHVFYLIDFRNRFLVMLEWSWAYFTHQRRSRLITDTRKI